MAALVEPGTLSGSHLVTLAQPVRPQVRNSNASARQGVPVRIIC